MRTLRLKRRLPLAALMLLALAPQASAGEGHRYPVAGPCKGNDCSVRVYNKPNVHSGRFVKKLTNGTLVRLKCAVEGSRLDGHKSNLWGRIGSGRYVYLKYIKVPPNANVFDCKETWVDGT